MMKFVAFSVACIALASALPYIVEDKEGQQYYLTPVLQRERRDLKFAPGGGGANRDGQGGAINFNNGAGFSASHGHIPGVGHIASADARVPVWSSKNKWGESTLNLGVGRTEYIGRYGNQNLDKRVGLNFNHRF